MLLPSTGLSRPGYLEKRFALLINLSLQPHWRGTQIHIATLKILNSSQRTSLIEQHGRNLFQMRTTPRHMCLQRNKQRTTTNPSTLGNTKMGKSRNNHRRHQRQRRRPWTTCPKTQNPLRLRRNCKKR